MQFKYLFFAISLLSTSFINAQKSELEQQGDESYRIFAYKQAIKKYEAAPILSTEGKRHLAISHLKSGNNIQAEQVYSSVVAQQDCITEDLYEYALVLRSNNKYDEAQSWMDKYASRAGDTKRARNNERNKDLLEGLIQDQGNYLLTNLGLNTPGQEFAPALYNGKLVFSGAANNIQIIERKYATTNERFLDLYVLDVGSLNSQERIPFKRKFNKKYHEGVATFTADGKRMYFTSNQEVEQGKNGEYNLGIFWSELNENGKWSNPVALPFNDPNYSFGQPSIDKNGKVLYFSSNMPGNFGGADLWKSTLKEDGTWTQPFNLGSTVNTESDELFPFIHTSGKHLFFTSNGHLGLGGMDIFVSTVDNGNISAPKNLGTPLNSSTDDFSFILGEDMKHGYLASNRYGGKGGDDIWSVDLVKPVDMNPEQVITGNVLRKSGIAIAEAKVELLDVKNKLIASTITDLSGKYFFRVPKTDKYTLKASADEFTDLEKQVITEKSENYIEFPLILSASKVVEIADTVLVAVKINPNDDKLITNTIQKVNGEKIVSDEKVISDGRVIESKNTGNEGKQTSMSTETVAKSSGITAVKATTVAETLEESTKTTVIPEVGTVVESLYFGFDLSITDVEGKGVLEKIVAELRKNSKMTIEMRSYTDCRADEVYNQMLSEKRLNYALNYIRGRISNPYRVRGIAMGELPSSAYCGCDSKETTCDDEVLKANRRIDFIVVKK